MCLYPKLIKNPKYRANNKNGGIIPAVSDNRVLYVPVGCQNCIECRKQKAREWQIRMLEDIKTNKNGKFIAFTFSNEAYKEHADNMPTLTGYELDNAIVTKAVRLFLERWRKQYKKSLRHWFVTELGQNGTENIHIHGIIWTNESKETVLKHWQYGHIWVGNYVNEKTVNYIIKYVTKADQKHPNYKSIILTSPGIGSNYTKQNKGDWTKNKYNGDNTNEAYRTRQGNKVAMPTYWRNKIYTEEEREKLWIQKLDKQERWVLGNRIDVSKTEIEYYQALKYAQEKNIRLGYGTGERNWEMEQYELDRRIMLQQKRLST